LNVISGLYIGFTFWKAKDSIQGFQNKLMALYSVLVLSFPLAMQVLIPFLDMRTIYEVREKHSQMYSWTALLTSQVLAEYPFNAVATTLNFFSWYWTVGFSSSRAGYVYLVIGVIFPMYYATLIQAIAAMSPDANVAGIFFGIMMSFVLL
jgi:ATP-binding cassette, subfamily G (WHITE), member 2, SNQ2